jgi:putative SOS response-associated peptidase YedK
MCGRFVSARKRLELLEEFAVARDRVADSPDPEPEPDYNVAPTRRVYAVMTRKDEERPAAAGGQASPAAAGGQASPAAAGGQASKARELRVVRWGLVPAWAKDASIGSKMINARAETVAVKPSYRRAFAKRRCIVPADGYYEWMTVTEEGKKPRKQPYYIHPENGGVLAFAGIYELWRDKERPDDDEHAWLWTAAIITTEAADEVGQIHDRMPMVIAPDQWEDWLDPDQTEPGEIQAALRPAMTGGLTLTSYAVSTDVNFVRNNSPELIRPLGGR